MTDIFSWINLFVGGNSDVRTLILLAAQVKFRQAKTVLKASKPANVDKITEAIASHKLGPRDFSKICNSILNKGKSVIPPLLNSSVALSSTWDKSKVFAERFSKNSNLHDSGILLPVFPSRNNV